MSEKYIDLTEEIWRADEGRTSFGSVSMVLAYLDDHPDQAPGRTITKKEWSEYVNSTNGKYLAGADLLEKAGITVVPDPEPTNAEKLELIWSNWDPTREGVVEFLDRRGVKAPGGDNE